MSRSNDPATSHYRRIFEHSPLPTLLCSRNGWRIVDANFAAEAAYGYSLDEFPSSRSTISGPWTGLTKANGAATSPKVSGNIAARTEPCSRRRSSRIRSRAGEHASHVLIAHELPPTPNEGPRLKLSSGFFDASSQAILITDADNLIVAVNTAFSKITGYAKHEVLGKTPQILSSGRHDADFYRQMWATIGKEDAWQGRDLEPSQEWRHLPGMAEHHLRVANLRGRPSTTSPCSAT